MSVVFVDVCHGATTIGTRGYTQTKEKEDVDGVGAERSLRDTEEDFQFNKTISKYIRKLWINMHSREGAGERGIQGGVRYTHR